MITRPLLVIVPDRLSEIVAKGEYAPRYYNPGELFDDVHLVSLTDDAIAPEQVQETVGCARLTLHQLPASRLFLRSFGYRPQRLNAWAQSAVELAARIRPALIRAYGSWLTAYVAARIKEALGVPYVVSLHINPDEDLRRRAVGWKERLRTMAMEPSERAGLQGADLVLPVYEPILPYLKRMGVTRHQVVYNVINPTDLTRKTDYALHRPVRILSVGRQFPEKNPAQILRAVSQLPGVHLTVVGDGPGHHALRTLARRCGIETRVTFHRAIPNGELCHSLPTYDLFAVHSEYWELSKATREALLTGLPVVINRRRGEPVPELREDIVQFVENTPDDYRAAFQQLIEDEVQRVALGRRAYEHAQARWAPEAMEAKTAHIYTQLMQMNGST